MDLLRQSLDQHLLLAEVLIANDGARLPGGGHVGPQGDRFRPRTGIFEMSGLRRVGLTALALSAATSVTVGCSPTATVDPTGSPSTIVTSGSPTQTAPTTNTGSPSAPADTAAPCTSQAIVGALPPGANISRFSCDGQYAGAVYKTATDEAAAILRYDSGSGMWTEDTSACVSGALPDSMKQYCVS